MPERNNEYVYQPPAKFTEELRQKINNAGFSDEFKQQIKSAQKEEGRKMFERLTERSPKNGMAYLINVKQNEQVVESPYPNTLRCIMDSFNRLAAYEDSGLTPEQVQELAKAEADGRLVVLPCKVGNAVYPIDIDRDLGKPPLRITTIRFTGFEHEGWIEAGCLKYRLDGIGKTVFFTKEEAEQALAGKKPEVSP
jgi:hypothetical protein